jgi:ComF family protein
LIYPFNACLICGKKHVSNGICTDCKEKLAHSSVHKCEKCGGFIVKEEAVCSWCQIERLHYIKEVETVAPYEGEYRRYILQYKFRCKRGLARPIGRLMAEQIKNKPAFSNIDAIVAVPIHPERLAERGYNQSLLLAKTVGQELDLPVITKALIRGINSNSQSQFGRKERFKNIKGAFGVGPQIDQIRGKKILLVDDIFTTGATMSNCAKLLSEAGAKEIIGLTAAGAKLPF